MRITSAPGRSNGWWIAVACCLSLTVSSGTGFYSFGVFFKPLMEEFGWGRAATSAAVSIYWLVMGVGSLLAGKLIDAYGPRRVMMGGVAASGACLLVLSLISDLWQLYLLYALTSLANASNSLIPVSSVISRWFKGKRGTAMGVALIGVGLGGAVVVPAAEYVISAWGWRAAYVGLGLSMWLTLPVVWLMIKEPPAEATGEASGRVLETGAFSRGRMSGVADLNLMGAVRTRHFWLFCVILVMTSVSSFGVLVHQVPLATDLGIAATAAAAALGLTAGAGAAGKPAFGYLADRITAKKALILCAGFQGVGVVLLLMTGELTMLGMFAVIFGFSMGGIVTLRPLVTSWLFGVGSFGVIMGTFEFVHGIGAALGPVAAGLVYDITGSYRGALIVFVLFYAAVALIAAFIRSPLEDRQRELTVAEAAVAS